MHTVGRLQIILLQIEKIFSSIAITQRWNKSYDFAKKVKRKKKKVWNINDKMSWGRNHHLMNIIFQHTCMITLLTIHTCILISLTIYYKFIITWMNIYVVRRSEVRTIGSYSSYSATITITHHKICFTW